MEKEAEAFKSVCFVTKSDDQRCKKLLDNLKSSAYIGRDECTVTIMSTYDLLVRESGKFKTSKPRVFFKEAEVTTTKDVVEEALLLHKLDAVAEIEEENTC